MARMNRLVRLWNWLPAFRVVAQTEHLPTASAQLHVSPSALSRTIRLLEEDIGHPLFDRVGRGLALNHAGRVMLSAVRDAMRRVDDALVELESGTLSGHFALSAPSAFIPVVVLPAMDQLMGAHPLLKPRLSTLPAPEVNARLLEGRLDLALLDDPVPSEELVIAPLIDITYGVYCGPGHPLLQTRSITPEVVTEHVFAAPPHGADDHWPSRWPRTVGVEVDSLDLGLRLCGSGKYLAVLPDLVASYHPSATMLTRLDLDLGGQTALHSVRRKPLAEKPGEVDEVLDVIQGVLEGL